MGDSNSNCFKYNERTKNIVVTIVCLFLCMVSEAPSGAIKNVALAESADFDLIFGYYIDAVGSAMAVVMCAIFHPVYEVIGIKATAVLTLLLYGVWYWTMIWIGNKYMVFVGSIIAGMGGGALWALVPMVIMDNSDEKCLQRNMGYMWVASSLGKLTGGLSNYLYFDGVTKISSENRQTVYGVCAGLTVLASIIGALGFSDVKEKSQRQGETPKFSALSWLKKMLQLPAFYMLILPLLYWGFMWGYVYSIVPTAAASISDSRNLIPLTVVISASCYLIGSACWNYVAKVTNNVFCITLASLMHLAALIISILTFPKSAASEILDVDTIETYIDPDSTYIVIILALMNIADSGISIIFYTAAGRVYGADGTSLGYSTNMIGYSVFYICSMFAPGLFDLHSYCYTMIAAVLVMCLTFVVGLRKYI